MKKYLHSALAVALMGGLLASCGKDAVSTPQLAPEARVAEGVAELSGSLRQDSLALVSLYQALNGESWVRSNYWLSGQPVSKWAGVKVADVAGKPRVVALALGANGLKGELPAAIGDLTALRSLHLQYNKDLTGKIPAELYQLRQLRGLFLGFTALTGELSESLANLTQLDTLDLRTSPYELSSSWDGNEKTARNHRANPTTLSGKLPVALGQLRQAKVIDLSHQSFTGELPKELGNLVQLHTLALYGNKLTGEIPVSLGELRSLRSLSLGKNQLSGALPASLGQLGQLRELLISFNHLSGELPASLGNLKRLENLNLEHNQLSGKLPEALASLTGLYQLYLNDNRFEGEIPTDFAGAQQPNLLWVNLANNNLSGLVPLRVRHYLPDASKYAKIKGLPDYGYTVFVLSGNRLTGAISSEYLQYQKTLKFLLPQQEGFGFSNLK